MSKQKVQYVKRAAPVRTFLAHMGIFLAVLMFAQLKGHVVVYVKPVVMMEASQEEGGWLSTLTR